MSKVEKRKIIVKLQAELKKEKTANKFLEGRFRTEESLRKQLGRHINEIQKDNDQYKLEIEKYLLQIDQAVLKREYALKSLKQCFNEQELLRTQITGLKRQIFELKDQNKFYQKQNEDLKR